MGLTLSEFKKAVDSLDTAVDLFESSREQNVEALKVIRDGCIQRFEYCIEAAWKTSMKLLGSQIAAAKPAIREMARNNLISDPQKWFSFIEARNESSHSYDEDIAQKVFSQIKQFQPELKLLLIELGKLI